IGVRFRAGGSVLRATTLLQFDQAKLQSPLAADPSPVASVLSAFKATAALNPGGPGSIDSISGGANALGRTAWDTTPTLTRGATSKFEQFLDPTTRTGGVLSSRQSQENDGINRMNDQIAQMNDRLAQQQQILQAKFARMESALSRLQSQKSALNVLAQAAGG